jgi:hypothetical protein
MVSPYVENRRREWRQNLKAGAIVVALVFAFALVCRWWPW